MTNLPTVRLLHFLISDWRNTFFSTSLVQQNPGWAELGKMCAVRRWLVEVVGLTSSGAVSAWPRPIGCPAGWGAAVCPRPPPSGRKHADPPGPCPGPDCSPHAPLDGGPHTYLWSVSWELQPGLGLVPYRVVVDLGQGPHVWSLRGFLTKTWRTQKSYAQINPDVSSLRKHAFTQILFVHPKLARN